MTDDMIDDTEDNIDIAEKTYLTGEVSKMLGMANTTIRKYSQSLESKGYSFLKGKGTGSRQARLYIDKDITVLRYLKEIREETNITVERATSLVVERFGRGTAQTTLPEKVSNRNELEQYVEQHEELQQTVNKQSELLFKQNELILNLSERLEHQEEYMNEQINEKLNKVSSGNKQIGAPSETGTSKNKGWLARILRILNG